VEVHQEENRCKSSQHEKPDRAPSKKIVLQNSCLLRGFNISEMRPNCLNAKWIDFLPFFERFKYCIVNKNWNRLINITPTSTLINANDLPFTELKRIGQLVTKLKFDTEVGSFLSFEIQMQISKYFTNLRVLKARICEHTEDEINAIAWSKLLRNNQNTLIDLTLLYRSGSSLRLPYYNIEMWFDGYIFPKVEYLSISLRNTTEFNEWWKNEMIHTFPNLKKLKIRCLDSSWDSDSDSTHIDSLDSSFPFQQIYEHLWCLEKLYRSFLPKQYNDQVDITFIR